jgi:hypothetical protein
VAGDRRILAIGWINPDIMFATVVTKMAAMVTQVLLQLGALHITVLRLIQQFGGHIFGGIRVAHE